MRTDRMSVTGVAVLLVALGGLANPSSAEVEPMCDLVHTTVAWREGVTIKAKMEGEVIETGHDGCYGIESVRFPLYLELQTPQDVFYEYQEFQGPAPGTSGEVEVDWGQGVPIASYSGGFGWYQAVGRIDWVTYWNPFETTDWGPWYSNCWEGCQVFVPAPHLELDGPTSTQQHSGVYISASLDPSWLAEAINWQGCSPVSGNLSCLFPASTTGQHVITASIGGDGPSDQWTVYVDP